MDSHYDVIIVGGGLAGLTLARQLGMTEPDARVLVLEAAAEPPPDAAHKVGESCVEIAGLWFTEDLGLGEHMHAEHLPKLGLRFFLGKGDSVEDRVELGPIRNKVPAPFEGLLLPSFQLDRGRFERHLADTLPAGVTLVRGAKVTDVTLGEPHTVRWQQGDTSHERTARWVIDATGRRQVLRKQLRLGRPSPHRANAVWFRTQKLVKVDEMGAHDAPWVARMAEPVRWASTNHFMGTGYWVWLIPLASGHMSVGIVTGDEHHELAEMADIDRAMDWLRRHEPQVARAVEDALDGAPPLDFHTRRQYPAAVSTTFSAERWGVTGDAGNFVDPLYSPGSDFVSIVNRGHLDLIRRDLHGEDIGGRAPRMHEYYDIFYDQFLRVYTGAYGLMGNPQVMAAKIAFDTAFYWGWPALLARNGVALDPDFMDEVRDTLMRTIEVQGWAQELFQRWNAAPVEAVHGGAIDQFDVATLWRLYVFLVRRVEGARLVHRVRSCADTMEALYEVLRQRASLVVPDLDLPAARPELADEVARVAAECEPLWLTEPLAAR